MFQVPNLKYSVFEFEKQFKKGKRGFSTVNIRIIKENRQKYTTLIVLWDCMIHER